MEKITGVLNVIKKLPLSRMGNPKYRVAINNVIFETGTNASLGYAITNYDNKKVIATFKTTFGSRNAIKLEEVKDLYTGEV